MGPNGEELETAAVVTTEANKTLHPIHHRMPVVIPPEAFDLWLDCRNVDADDGGGAAGAGAGGSVRGLRDFAGGEPRGERLSGFAGAGAAQGCAGERRSSECGGCRAGRSPAKRARKPKKDDRQSSLF